MRELPKLLDTVEEILHPWRRTSRIAAALVDDALLVLTKLVRRFK